MQVNGRSYFVGFFHPDLAQCAVLAAWRFDSLMTMMTLLIFIVCVDQPCFKLRHAFHGDLNLIERGSKQQRNILATRTELHRNARDVLLLEQFHCKSPTSNPSIRCRERHKDPQAGDT